MKAFSIGLCGVAASLSLAVSQTYAESLYYFTDRTGHSYSFSDSWVDGGFMAGGGQYGGSPLACVAKNYACDLSYTIEVIPNGYRVSSDNNKTFVDLDRRGMLDKSMTTYTYNVKNGNSSIVEASLLVFDLDDLARRLAPGQEYIFYSYADTSGVSGSFRERADYLESDSSYPRSGFSCFQFSGGACRDFSFSITPTSFDVGANANSLSHFEPAARDQPGTYTYYVNGRTSAVLNVLTVTAAPEPTTWVMMMLGVGAIGYTLRRRPRLGARTRSA